MKPQFEKYRYRGGPGEAKVITLRMHTEHRTEVQQLADLEGDSFSGLCIEGIGRVFEARIEDEEYRSMIRETRLLNRADAARYISPEAIAYRQKYEQYGNATEAVSFRSPYILTQQLNVMSSIEHRSVSSVCFEGLALVAADRKQYPYVALDDFRNRLDGAFRVVETLLPPEVAG